jgi:hypothetical protein
MQRFDIINYLIQKNGYKSYLEIGVEAGDSIQQIKIDKIYGVDPNSSNPLVTHKMTSDEFFKQLSPQDKYDIVFIDGLHVYEQVLRDILNSLEHLTSTGTIVVHDCNPPSEWHQRSYEEAQKNGCRLWNGTVWKAIVWLRANRSDVSVCTVNTDWGCGIIRKGSHKVLEGVPATLEYSDLEKNRVNWLNLISTEQFLSLY